MKLEFGTLRWTMEVREGVSTLHLQVLQDNTFELRPHIPDGVYSWTMVLDADTAEKAEQMPEEWKPRANVSLK